MAKMLIGSCLCGSVAFEVKGPLAPVSACHCSQCRKQSGHHWASTHVANDAVTFSKDTGLCWYTASDIARRGFCGTCGSFLFWDPTNEDGMSISMGAFDGPTLAKVSRHIFVADKGDYYDLDDGLPQRDG